MNCELHNHPATHYVDLRHAPVPGRVYVCEQCLRDLPDGDARTLVQALGGDPSWATGQEPLNQ